MKDILQYTKYRKNYHRIHREPHAIKAGVECMQNFSWIMNIQNSIIIITDIGKRDPLKLLIKPDFTDHPAGIKEQPFRWISAKPGRNVTVCGRFLALEGLLPACIGRKVNFIRQKRNTSKNTSPYITNHMFCFSLILGRF